MLIKQDVKDILYAAFWGFRILFFLFFLFFTPFVTIVSLVIVVNNIEMHLSESVLEISLLIFAYALQIALSVFFNLKIIHAYRGRSLKILIGILILYSCIFIVSSIFFMLFSLDYDSSIILDYILTTFLFVLTIGIAYAIDKSIFKSKPNIHLKDLAITRSSNAFYQLVCLFVSLTIIFLILYGVIVGSYKGFLFIDIDLSYFMLLATALFIISHHHRYKPYAIAVNGLTGIIIGALIKTDLLHDVSYFILT